MSDDHKAALPLFCMFAWLNPGTTEEQFEEHVPLMFCAEALRSRGSLAPLTVLFLGGYENLSVEYKRKAANLGLDLIDCAAFYSAAAARYQPLNRFNSYEVHCFLRWVVLGEYARAVGFSGQILHFDGDVVFGATLEEISADLRGTTFVLAGCPAVTSITNYEWLQCYVEELDKFVSDPVAYSEIAWSERDGYEESANQKWSGYCWFREIISSDQDLISYLIHADKIPQDRPETIVHNFKLFYAQNPMWIQYHNGGQLGKSTGLNFTSDGTNCYLDGKKIALWHFQSDFSMYVNLALVLRSLRLPVRCPNQILKPKLFPLFRLARKMTRFSRLSQYAAFRELSGTPNPKSVTLAAIYNSKTYWERGVIAPKTKNS